MGTADSRTRLSSGLPGSIKAGSEYHWECPYCKGLGIDPHNSTGIKNCPACRGRIFWESDSKTTELQLCEYCEGTGEIQPEGKWQVCPECSGAGRV